MGEARLANLTGAVLTGGSGTRLGRDKSRAEIAGIATATRLAAMLARICEEVLLVGGDPPPDAPGRRVPDPPGTPCALRGVVGALAAARGERVLVVATDLPLLPPALLLGLCAWPEADAVAPRAPGGRHALCALFARERALAVASRRLAAGELALHGLLAELGSAWLEGAELARLDPDGAALCNVNTPADLARAEAMLAARGGAA
jgi:molybdopterin-guanine dinucleotide biosynthesis protein A